MENNQRRIEEFKSEIDSLNLKGSSGENEQKFLIAGIALMVVGVLLAVYGAVQVGNNGGSLADQVAFMAQGSLVGIVLALAGGMLFLRYSLGRYLRFWMIRQTYESRANTDRLVDAIERAAGLEPTTLPRPAAAQQFAPQAAPQRAPQPTAPPAAAPAAPPAAAPTTPTAAPAAAPQQAPQPQFAPPPPPTAPLR